MQKCLNTEVLEIHLQIQIFSKRVVTPNTGTFHLPPWANSQKIPARSFATHHVFYGCAQGSECSCISCDFEPGSCSLLNRSKHEPPKDRSMATVLFPRCHRPRKTNAGLNTAWVGAVGQWEGYQGAVSGPGIHLFLFLFFCSPPLVKNMEARLE